MSCVKFSTKAACLFLLTILLTSLMGLQAQAEWKSAYHQDHQLVGKIFSTHDESWITQQELREKIKPVQFLLLGETHTNEDHHIGQARLIKDWLKDDKPTTLVMEMLFYEDHQDDQLKGLNIEALTEILENIAPRWNWELYQSILQLKIDHQLPIVGGNLTREQLDAYSSAQTCKVERNAVAIDVCTIFNDTQQQTLKQLIYDAHCDYLPMQHTQPMMMIQLAKDASFSLAIKEIAGTHQVALIAGAIHVRKDIGVPVHLRKLTANSMASVAFINVHQDKIKISEYFEENSASEQYDYIIFTPSDRIKDPCEEFAEQLKKMSHPKK